MASLDLNQVTMRYNKTAGVENINLHVKSGELLTLLGPSGCGKTTLLRLIGGFLQPTNGSIAIDNHDVTNIPTEKRPTALVFQQYNLWPHMTVFDNLAFGLKIRRLAKNEIEAAVKEALDLIHLPDVAKRKPSQLSGGQQQRIALVRALLLKPKILLLDEPFSSLDAKLRIELRSELKRIQRETQMTMVFVTHDQEEALYLSDRIVVMKNGQIEQIASPEKLYDEPETTFVAQFIGEMNFFDSSVSQAELKRLTGAKGTKFGTNLIAMARPEHIHVHSDKGPLPARVVQTFVAGHYFRIELDTPVGKLVSYCTRQGGDVFSPGQTVYIDVSKIHTIPEAN